MQRPILTLENFKVHYPLMLNNPFKSRQFVKAVDGVNLKIFPGKALALVGESGCGKTSIGKALIGLEKMTAGSAGFYGKDGNFYPEIGKMPLLHRKIQIVFQDPYSSLNPKKKVYDILAEPLNVHRIVPRNQVPDRVGELISLVHLDPSMSHRYPYEFSGGQRQRIGIARALSVDPELIILDEPVSSLDVSVQAQILNLLKELKDSMHLSYLFIAHGLGAVKYISDEVAVMYRGKIVEQAETSELFKNPLHPYTQLLLDSYLTADPRDRSINERISDMDKDNATEGCAFSSRCPLAAGECFKKSPVLPEGSHRAACFLRQNPDGGEK
jgi:oligopeptide/dipeptide ABC transporter ATP-binding protein